MYIILVTRQTVKLFIVQTSRKAQNIPEVAGQWHGVLSRVYIKQDGCHKEIKLLK